MAVRPFEVTQPVFFARITVPEKYIVIYGGGAENVWRPRSKGRKYVFFAADRYIGKSRRFVVV